MVTTPGEGDTMKAKRGDLVVIERKTSYVTTSQGWHEDIWYEVGIVSSITRDGQVKAYRDRYSQTPKDAARQVSNVLGFVRSYVMPAAEIDVEPAARAAWANEWKPGYPGKPFDSLEEAKSVLRPFVLSAAA
jgi:hypothetical protein